tara:strand:+ start:171 stop:464 length:294 start_codon:yes stop_codon:yes gene_type:complete
MDLRAATSSRCNTRRESQAGAALRVSPPGSIPLAASVLAELCQSADRAISQSIEVRESKTQVAQARERGRARLPLAALVGGDGRPPCHANPHCNDRV